MGTFVTTVPEDHPIFKEQRILESLPEHEEIERIGDEMMALQKDYYASKVACNFFTLETTNGKSKCAITGQLIPKGLKAIRIPNDNYRKGTTFISLHAIKRYGLLDNMKSTLEEAEKEIEKIRANTVVDPNATIEKYEQIHEDYKDAQRKGYDAVAVAQNKTPRGPRNSRKKQKK